MKLAFPLSYFLLKLVFGSLIDGSKNVAANVNHLLQDRMGALTYAQWIAHAGSCLV